MKTLKLLFLTLVCAVSFSSYAQSNFINYQGLAKDTNGDALVNQNILVTIDLRFGSQTGTIDYQENHNISTDDNGVFSLQIGNGNPMIGNYQNLVWGEEDVYISTSIDNTLIGTTELHSVPFANSALNVKWNENNGVLYNTNTGNVGIGTTSPGAKLMVVGEDNTATTPAVNIANSDLNSLLHIKNDGKVGLGTTSPGAKLMVVADDNSATSPVLNITDGSLNSVMHIKNGGRVGLGTTSPGAKLMVVGEDNTATTPAVNIANSDLNSLLHIKNDGKVGLGTTSPGAKLMVVADDNSATSPVLNITDGSLNSVMHIKNGGRVGIGTTSPGAKLMVVGEDNTATTPVVNIANSDLNSLLHIKNDGKVGIGTTSPTESLEVDGNVKATTFFSAMNTYPDYVFESYFEGKSKINKDYEFQNLDAVERFIKEHKHIKGYKPIDELEKNSNGEYVINTSEQSLKNQEKIEELFLYIIELKNKIKKLEKQLNQE